VRTLKPGSRETGPGYDPAVSVEQYMDWARARVERVLTMGPAQRLVAVVVMSVDSVLAVDGRSAALSSEPDRALIGAWREAADALLVGAPTLSAEVYGGGLFTADARRRRVARGVAATPPVITVDRSGSLDIELATRARQPLDLVVYTAPGLARPDHRAEWIEHDDLGLAAVAGDVRARFGHQLIVAEPGPRLLQALREERILTDLSLTIAPILVDHGPRLAPAAHASQMRAVAVEIVQDVVFAHFLALRDCP
jgi:riboflavin biosynthesis pyrimidine reductase